MYQQYLAKYAAVEARMLDDFPVNYNKALLIPAFDEDLHFAQEHLANCSKRQGLLLIIVINQPDDLLEPQAKNIELADFLQHSGPKLWQQQHLTLYRWPNNNGLLLVDRFSSGKTIPRKQGVGLARKIAADIASALIAQKNISSDWIYSSDADARLPENYFCLEQQTEKDCSAATFCFRHGEVFAPADAKLLAATRLYEQALDYYVKALGWAGSGYAYHTIGSCLAFTAKAYCQARGFPSRAAGEDFYLLNKLAKLGRVLKPDSAAIELQARASARVPFGTGPAVNRIIELQALQQPYCYYHPQCFVELKTCLQAAQTLSPSDQQSFWQALPFISQQALQSLGIDKFFKHCQQQCKTPAQAQQHWLSWFDAFRTLKFLHFWRQQQYPDIELSEALVKFHQISVL